MLNLNMFHLGAFVIHLDNEPHHYKGVVTRADKATNSVLVHWYNDKLSYVCTSSHPPEDLRAYLDGRVRQVVKGINAHWRELHKPQYQSNEEDKERAFNHQAAILRTVLGIADALELSALERETFIEACSKKD